METNTNQKAIQIYFESSPNPNSLKFVVNFMLFPAGESYDFPNSESASYAPLAQKLFELDYVDRVFYMSNFVTITKNTNQDWDQIKQEIKQIIHEFLQNDLPLLDREKLSENTTTDTSANFNELEQKIVSLLDEYVRPAVEQDGGAITFESFEDGVVKVALKGSCSGCPASTVTLKSGIENLLTRMVPEVTSVEAVG